MPDPDPPAGWLNRTIIGAGLTSLLADVAYEMATAVMPGFFRVLAIPGVFLGLTEGTADALANFVKLGVGYHSERIGKGLRGPLRDALLADSVPPNMVGKAFGFHRAGDTDGAVIGPLLGALLV